MARFLSFGSTVSGNSLRNAWQALSRTFYSTPSQPSLRDSTVDYEATRRLYYNQEPGLKHGSVFARGIVDGCADFINFPHLTVQDETTDQFLNDCISKYWKTSILNMYRMSMRDSKCWARLRRPIPGPLTGPDEAMRLELEIMTAERATPYYNPITNELDRLEVMNRVWIEEEPFQVRTQRDPAGKFHDILEIIYPDRYEYWDLTTETQFEGPIQNEWGFIPVVEVFNEFDPTLNGGSSDLESAYIFLKAFDDVMLQTRTAHKNHATPKVKFKIEDIMTFIGNNYPDAIVNGEFTGKINWKGQEILFMEKEEDAGFLEARSSVVGDSVTLLNFLIDCISISSRTPKWVLMKFAGQEVAAKSTSEDLPFENRIKGKRTFFEEPIKKLAKMALVVYGEIPQVPAVSWSEIKVEDLAAQSQALSQFVTASEVANRAGAISLSTYRSGLRRFYPAMKTDAKEQAAAQAEQAALADAELQRQIKLAKAKTKATPQQPPNTGQNGIRPPMAVGNENS